MFKTERKRKKKQVAKLGRKNGAWAQTGVRMVTLRLG